MYKNCQVISVVLYGTVPSKQFQYWYFTKLSFQNCTKWQSVYSVSHTIIELKCFLYKNYKTLLHSSQHTHDYPDCIPHTPVSAPAKTLPADF